MKKLLILGMILLLQACASSERTKILESNVKNIEVYAADGQLICKEMPCPIKFNKKEGKSQTVKLKLDGFEAEEEVSVKIWNGERSIRRMGSSFNVVLYPVSTIDALVIGAPAGIIMDSFFDSLFGHNFGTEVDMITKGTTAVAYYQMRMVNDIWFYDPDHIYIDVKLCDKNNQCVSPKLFGDKGYGYKVSKETSLIIKESKLEASLITKDEIITKRFVLHNYAEIKAHNWEYMRELINLTGLSDSELQKIIDKSKSAPKLAETLARYNKKKNRGT